MNHASYVRCNVATCIFTTLPSIASIYHLNNENLFIVEPVNSELNSFQEYIDMTKTTPFPDAIHNRKLNAINFSLLIHIPRTKVMAFRLKALLVSR